MVMAHPLVKDAAQVAFCQRNHQVQALPPQCAQESLTKAIGFGTPHWSFQHPEPEVAHGLVEVVREDPVAVMDEELVPMVSRHRFAELLYCPLGRGMHRHVAMQNPTRGVLHQHEDIEETKGRRDHRAEIAGDDGFGVVADKCHPVLGWDAAVRTTVEALGHVLADGSRRHAQTKLEEQLISDAFFTPRRIVTSHPADERLQISRNRWSSRTGCPPPKEPEPQTMPADQRGWLDDDQSAAPVEPAGEPDQGETGGMGGAPWCDRALPIQGQPLAKKKIFGGKGG